MSFDISLGESPPELSIPSTLDEFYATYVTQIVSSLSLACNDSALADQAATWALTRLSQRWSHVGSHENPVGWVINAGLRHADKSLRDEGPVSVNQATGGYVRGLELGDALDALPLYQRASLVTGYYLGWSDEFTAAGFEVPVATLRTRRTRAVSFIGHHLRLAESDVEPLLRAHLAERQDRQVVHAPELPTMRRRGRRLTARNRIAATLLVATVIIGGGALFRSAGGETTTAPGPEPVPAPQTSSDWFDPVSDGDGAFVALNVRGSSRFVTSVDGDEWFAGPNWNSRAIDLRTEVSGFLRTGDRYVATIEQVSALSDFVAPRIATSHDLASWTVRQIEIDKPPPVDGLRRSYSVVGSAASGDHVLVGLQTVDELDHLSFGIRPDEVCGETITPSEHRYFLCDAETVFTVGLNGAGTNEPIYFLAADGDRFAQVQLPANTAPRSLVGFGGGFAIIDPNQGQVWVSPNGADWERATTSSTASRFVLIEGGRSGALVIEPDETGWASHVIARTGLGASGDIPLDVAPAGIWTQPDVAWGPAGWALFVTTSRPWERAGGTPGWAIATPEWVVSKLPDADAITAQSVPDGTTVRLAVQGPWVHLGDDGTVILRDPHDNTTLVEVTQQEREQARTTSLNESSVKAQVFFSPDGVTWASVWASTDDAWSGAIAVGDDEIVLSGTQLTGRPITITLDD